MNRRTIAAWICAAGLTASLVGGAETRAEEREPALITFSGLRVYDDGSATVFVNLTRRTAVEVTRHGSQVQFTLAGAKVELKNNRNPLRAEYFHSNVLRAKLDNTREGARLTIQLRKDVATHHELVDRGPGEATVLRIDVPPPS